MLPLRMRRIVLALVCGLLLVGCAARGAGGGFHFDMGASDDAGSSADGAILDGTTFDAPNDASALDMSVHDAAPIDSSTLDASAMDASTDSGSPDAGIVDLGAPDTGPTDLGAVDAPVACDVCGTCDTNPANDCYLCGASNTDDVVNGGSSTGGPNLYFAMQFDAATVLKVKRAEVFTGEGSGSNTMSIWSNDTATTAPLAMLDSASFTLASTNSWQGVNFSSVHEFAAGSFGWIVWQPLYAQQSPFAPSGESVTYRGAFGSPSGWNGPYTTFIKLRLYCVD